MLKQTFKCLTKKLSKPENVKSEWANIGNPAPPPKKRTKSQRKEKVKKPVSGKQILGKK